VVGGAAGAAGRGRRWRRRIYGSGFLGVGVRVWGFLGLGPWFQWSPDLKEGVGTGGGGGVAGGGGEAAEQDGGGGGGGVASGTKGVSSKKKRWVSRLSRKKG
jgi:hypothetical protein